MSKKSDSVKKDTKVKVATAAEKNIKKVQLSPIVIVKAGESQIQAFLDFIRSQGVIGLAVGLVLGGAVSVLVKSLIDNVVMPPLGLLLGSADGLKGLSFVIANTHGKATTISYGVFLNDFVNFIIIALVIYLIFKVLGVEKLDKKKV